MMNKHFLIDLSCFLVLITLAVAVWFHSGLMIAGGESALPFGNPQHYLYLTSSAWTDSLFGFPSSIGLVAYLLYFFFSHLASVGIPPVTMQASLFWCILFIAGLFTYLTVLENFKNPIIARIATLCYLCNFYVIFNIWARLQYPYIFFFALLPVGFYFFQRGLQRKNYYYLLAFNISLFILCVAYGDLPALELLWFLLFAYSLFHVLTEKKSLRYTVFYFLSSVISWFLFNLWWILPFIKTLSQTSYITTVAVSATGDIITFIEESASLGNLAYVFRLEHAFYAKTFTDIWGTIYFSPLFILLSFAVPVFAFFPLFLKKKPKELYFYLFLSLLLIFLMKGSSEPFGGVFLFFFSHFRILEPFRNPFEKFGLAISFAFAPLVGYGLYTMYSTVASRKGTVIANWLLVITCVLLFGVLVFPIWNGWVFTNPNVPARNLKIGDSVLVPTYYANARNYLVKNVKDTRIIGLPIAPEGVINTWQYGYNGVDLSNALLNVPSISVCTGIEFLCPITSDLEPLLLQYPNDFWKVFEPLGARYLMVRSDINAYLRGMRSPQDITNVLKIIPKNLSNEKTFGPLTFYSSHATGNYSFVFASNTGTYVDSGLTSFISLLPIFNPEKNTLYFTDPTKNNITLTHSQQIVVKAQPYDREVLNISKENALYELPYVRFLPTSRLYPLVTIKESIMSFLAGNNNFSQIITMSDKRAVEIYRLTVEKQRFDLSQKELPTYVSLLQSFMNNTGQFEGTSYKSDIVRQKYVLMALSDFLKQHHQKSTDVDATVTLLHNLLNKLGVEPLYAIDTEKSQAFHFTIPKKGIYTIQLQTRGIAEYYDTNTLDAVIDGTRDVTAAVGDSQFANIITQNFDAGEHEIALQYPATPVNLISKTTTILQSSHKTVHYTIPLKPFDPFTAYKISFDFTVKQGNAPEGYITQDSDQVVKGILYPKEQLQFNMDIKKNSIYHFETEFVPDNYAHSIKLVFTVYPQNFCKDHNKGDEAAKCKNSAYYHKYDLASIVQISNLQFVRNGFGDVIISSDNSHHIDATPQITYQKISPAIYHVQVHNANNPFFLGFLQSYHPLWKAYIINHNGTKETIPDTNHILINSFANSWYISKKGSYDMLLEFTPEESFHTGIIVSTIAIGISILLLGYKGFVLFQKKRRKHA